jgi:hypothetical protein
MKRLKVGVESRMSGDEKTKVGVESKMGGNDEVYEVGCTESWM